MLVNVKRTRCVEPYPAAEPLPVSPSSPRSYVRRAGDVKNGESWSGSFICRLLSLICELRYRAVRTSNLTVPLKKITSFPWPLCTSFDMYLYF